MKELRTWRDVIQAMLDGKAVQYFDGEKWVDRSETYHIHISRLDKSPPTPHQIKPQYLKIGDIEVPEPVRDAGEMEHRGIYYTPYLGGWDFHMEYSWTAHEFDFNLLNKGLIHKNKEAAIAHAKALIKASGGDV